MLVLSRRIGDKVCIGNGIVVTVLKTRGGRLQLGIEAPAHIPVDRAEIRVSKSVEMEPSHTPGTPSLRPRSI